MVLYEIHHCLLWKIIKVLSSDGGGDDEDGGMACGSERLRKRGGGLPCVLSSSSR